MQSIASDWFELIAINFMLKFDYWNFAWTHSVLRFLRWSVLTLQCLFTRDLRFSLRNLKRKLASPHRNANCLQCKLFGIQWLHQQAQVIPRAFHELFCYRFSSERDSALGNYATQSCMQVVTFTIYCVFSRTHDFGCSTLHRLHDTAGAATVHERRTACTTHDLQVFCYCSH